RRVQLRDHGLARLGREPRVDLDPPASRLERQQRRHLVDEHGCRLLAGVVVGDRGVDDRQPRCACRRQQPFDRLDHRLEVAVERRLVRGEADAHVDDDQRRPPAEPGPAVKPLELHYSVWVICRSPCSRTRRSASSPDSIGAHASGSGGTGGSRPVSSFARARICSSAGPMSKSRTSPRSARSSMRSFSVASASPTTTPYSAFAFSADTSPFATSASTFSTGRSNGSFQPPPPAVRYTSMSPGSTRTSSHFDGSSSRDPSLRRSSFSERDPGFPPRMPHGYVSQRSSWIDTSPGSR